MCGTETARQFVAGAAAIRVGSGSFWVRRPHPSISSTTSWPRHTAPFGAGFQGQRQNEGTAYTGAGEEAPAGRRGVLPAPSPWHGLSSAGRVGERRRGSCVRLPHGRQQDAPGERGQRRDRGARRRPAGPRGSPFLLARRAPLTAERPTHACACVQAQFLLQGRGAVIGARSSASSSAMFWRAVNPFRLQTLLVE